MVKNKDLEHFLKCTRRVLDNKVEDEDFAEMLDEFSSSSSGLYWRAWGLFIWPLLCGRAIPEKARAKSDALLRSNLGVHPWAYIMGTMTRTPQDSFIQFINDMSNVNEFREILRIICKLRDSDSYSTYCMDMLIDIISLPHIKTRLYNWAERMIEQKEWDAMYLLNAVLALMVKHNTSENINFVRDIFYLYHRNSLMGDYLIASGLSNVILSMNAEFLEQNWDDVKSLLDIMRAGDDDLIKFGFPQIDNFYFHRYVNSVPVNLKYILDLIERKSDNNYNIFHIINLILVSEGNHPVKKFTMNLLSNLDTQRRDIRKFVDDAIYHLAERVRHNLININENNSPEKVAALECYLFVNMYTRIVENIFYNDKTNDYDNKILMSGYFIIDPIRRLIDGERFQDKDVDDEQGVAGPEAEYTEKLSLFEYLNSNKFYRYILLYDDLRRHYISSLNLNYKVTPEDKKAIFDELAKSAKNSPPLTKAFILYCLMYRHDMVIPNDHSNLFNIFCNDENSDFEKEVAWKIMNNFKLNISDDHYILNLSKMMAKKYAVTEEERLRAVEFVKACDNDYFRAYAFDALFAPHPDGIVLSASIKSDTIDKEKLYSILNNIHRQFDVFSTKYGILNTYFWRSEDKNTANLSAEDVANLSGVLWAMFADVYLLDLVYDKSNNIINGMKEIVSLSPFSANSRESLAKVYAKYRGMGR